MGQLLVKILNTKRHESPSSESWGVSFGQTRMAGETRRS